MPLLLAYRRWWCFFFMAVLALPTLGLVLPDLPGPVRLMTTPQERWWVHATERLDPFINGRYGFRGLVMAGNASYLRAMKSTRERPVLLGEGGQMFFTGEQTLEQSLGRLFRAKPMGDLVDVLARLDTLLKARGAELVVASAPNAATVLPEKLPAWARGQMTHPTELDYLDTQMAAHAIPHVDLRPVLIAAKAQGPIFRRTDTHWNQRSSVLAFNAVMAAAGRPELEIAPQTAIGPLQAAPSGDLARYLGEASETADQDYAEIASNPKPELTPITGIMPDHGPHDTFRPYAYATGHSGPSVLVIGDSFSQHFWPRLLERVTSRFAWMHHSACKFEWPAVERFKPDLVIYMVTERSLPCRGQPIDMPPG
ncbi:alginate O-acetyltransferase AlgX-related protein [Roseixanthobacter pseudopolyaromaticivorans]|uniref:alginate O-acetyltransferase AlgX-related protein n=1 Tax=Xanthobacteraceae TaxID=335928 RepID=UPI0037282C92